MIDFRAKSKIKKLAESIALSFDESPTPLEKILEIEDLEVFYDDYNIDTFDGMTIYDKKRFYIHINTSNRNPPGSARCRFTLAHELGHYIIDSHRIGLKLGLLEPFPSKTNQKQFYEIEREADYFASCLLIPESRFKEDVIKKKFSFELIQSLCNKYKVSVTACAFRFAQIGNHPIMIIYSENGFVKWKMESDDFPYKYILNNKAIPVNTIMGEYFSKPSKRDVYTTEKVWALDWFDYVGDEDINRVFYEHCIPYKNKALSIIWED
ncbi:MAG TPA: ImmA/IrrE family metallo-endopeptidase [Pelobium sp.]|nr:ImmA/IrrE family metallo-endopeptidase [Pelobium sp.]